jgi:hypothetical protein
MRFDERDLFERRFGRERFLLKAFFVERKQRER